MTVKNISKPIGIAFLIIAGILAFGFDGYGDYIWTMAALYLLVFIGLVVREYKNKDLSKGFFAEKKYVIFFAIYAFWLFISPYWSTWFDISRITVWILLLTPLGFFVSVCLTVNSNEKKLFIYSYFAVGIFLFLWANLDFFATKSRTDGPLNDSNVFAGLLVAFILPVFAFLLTFNPESKSQKRIYEYSYIYITFGMLAFFTTSSRSATFAFGVVGILLILKLIKDYKFKYFNRLFTLILITTISFLTINHLFSAQSSLSRGDDAGVSNLLNDTAVDARLKIWMKSIELYKKNPIKGIGFGQYRNFYKQMRSVNETNSSGQYAHNDYLQFLVEGGVIQIGFIILLAILIIVRYFKLFFVKSTSTDRHKNFLKISLLSVVCVFFIQANANFMLYMAPIALSTGIILGIVFRTNEANSFTLNQLITARVVFTVSGLIALGFIFIDTYIQSDFYATPNVLEKEKADALYKKANRLSVIRPRSLALARYKFLYKLNKPQSRDSLKDLHQSLENIFRLNRNDSFATHFLARFAQNSPDDYKKLQTEYADSGFYQKPEELFYRSMRDDPSLLPNYYQLRLIYIAQNEREKAYRLFSDKLLPRFDFGEISMPEQVPVIVRMLKDAEELGLVNDVVKYASILLYIDSCHEYALSAIGAQRPEKCTIRFR